PWLTRDVEASCHNTVPFDKWKIRDRSSRGNAFYRPNAFEKITAECRGGMPIGITAGWQGDFDRQNTLCCESRIGVLQPEKTANHRPRRDQKQDRQRDFTGHKATERALTSWATSSGTTAFVHQRPDVGRRELRRRGEAHHHTYSHC